MSPRLLGGILMLGFGAMELFMRQGNVAKSVAATATDRGTTLVIVSSYALAVLAISTNLLPSVDLKGAVPWVGVGVGLAGFVLRIWAMRVLGRFYTRRLVTTSEQRVVQEGPYRFVRHPGYLGSLLVWTGASAASGNLISVAAVTVLLAAAYAYRIRMEERMLVDALGQPYEEYQQRSWRLLPFVF